MLTVCYHGYCDCYSDSRTVEGQSDPESLTEERTEEDLGQWPFTWQWLLPLTWLSSITWIGTQQSAAILMLPEILICVTSALSVACDSDLCDTDLFMTF